MRQLSVFTVFLILTFIPRISQAQWSIGPHIIISIPQQDFANVSDAGGGFGIKGVYRFPSLLGLGLRADFGYISYGSEIRSVTVGGLPFGARAQNQSFRLTFGPQFSFGTKSLRFQLNGLGGFYFFRTNLTITDGFGNFASASEDNIAELGWSVGGGIQYDIGLGPWLDLAVEYNSINNIPGPAPENQGEPRPDIDAKDITLKIGVVFFIGG